MSNMSLIMVLVVAELALVAVVAAAYFYRKSKRLEAGGVEPSELTAASLSYSQALRQQIALTRDFIETATHVSHRALAERRLQYLEGELAAYLTDDTLPNWDVLSPLLAGLFTIPSVSDRLEEPQELIMPEMTHSAVGESEDVWQVLSQKALDFLVMSSRQGDILSGFCEGRADTGEIFVVFDRMGQTKQALTSAISGVAESMGQPIDELSQLVGLLDQYQQAQGNCADAVVQGGGSELLQTSMCELLTLEQMISELAVSLQIIDPIELSAHIGEVNANRLACDSDDTVDDMQFLVIDDASALPDMLQTGQTSAAAAHNERVPSVDELMAMQMLEMNVQETPTQELSVDELMAMQMLEMNAPETSTQVLSVDELMEAEKKPEKG